MTRKPETCKEHTKLSDRVERIEGKLSILIGLNVATIGLIMLFKLISG